MKKLIHFLGIGAFLLAFLLIGCKPDKEMEATGEIPVTYKSEEALASYNKGLELVDNVRFQEARNHFLAAVRKDPSFIQAQLNMALVANDNEEFQKHYNKLLTLKDKANDGERLMIESLEASVNNDPATAIGKATAALALYPQDKRTYLWLAGLHLNQNENTEAIEALNKAIEVDSRYVNAYNMLGYTYMNTEDYEKAEKNFKMYIDLEPREANPYDSYGDLLKRMGRFQEAIDNYRKAVVLNETFDFSQQKQGECYLYMGSYDKARDMYAEAADMAVTPFTKTFNTYLQGETYLYQGSHDMYQQKAQEAIENAEAENLPGTVAAIYSRKFFAYLDQGDLENAQYSLETGRSVVEGSNLLPSQKKNWKEQHMMEEAALLAHKGEKDAAMDKLEELKTEVEANKNPQREYLYHLGAGYVHEQMGNYEDAITHLQQADPQSVFAKYLMGISYAAIDKGQEAAGMFKEVVDYNQQNRYYALVREAAREKLDNMAP